MNIININQIIKCTIQFLVLVVCLFAMVSSAQAASLEYMVRENTTDTTAVSTTETTFGWNNQIYSAGTAITYSGNAFELTLGKYLVLYSQKWETSDTTNNTRKEIQGRIELGGTTLAAGASQCYIRKNSGQQECVTSGNAIVDVATATTSLATNFYKTDDDPTGIPTREETEYNGVQVIKLNDTFNYARYAITGTSSADDTLDSTHQDIVWNATTEEDTGFSRSGADITISTAGRYLVSYSVPMQLPPNGGTTANRTEYTSRLTLDDVEVEGTRVSTYMRAGESTNDGVLNYIGIIDVAAGDVLTVENSQNDGIDAIFLASSIEIMQLPNEAKTFIREATSGLHNPATETEFSWDTIAYEDTDTFTVNSATDSYTEVDIAGDYLFFWTQQSDAGGVTRANPTARVSVNDVVQEYASSDQYNRNDESDNVGHSHGIFTPGLSAGDDISLVNFEWANSASSLIVDHAAMSGLRLDTLYAGAGGGGSESVSITGTLYESDGVTPITTGKTITVAVGTSTPSLHSTTTDASGNFSISGIATSSAKSWSGVTAAGDDDDWLGVTYGNGTFVAVGDTGGGTTDAVMTSPDGITWTVQTAAGDNDNWRSITYNNGLFVVVGDTDSGADAVMTSPDGITWTVQTAAGDNDNWQDVVYGKGRFVAVGTNGGIDRVMTSPDGITWTVQTAAGDNDFWQAITYGNGTFVAVSEFRDRVMYSSDGITWATTTAAGDNDTWRGITYANELFVAVGTGLDRLMVSRDGATWFPITSAGGNDTWFSITYGNGRTVAVGTNSGDDVVMTSTSDFRDSTPVTVYIDGETEKATTITYGLVDGGTISGIDLFADTVRLQHSSTSGSINLANADFYDASDDADILFTATSGTTTINASLDVATNTTMYAPQTLVINGDAVLGGEFRAERGTLRFASSSIGSLFNFKRTGEQLFVDRATAYDKFYVSDNGLKLYMLEDNAARIDEFDLSVAWDISTATSNNASTTVGSQVEDFHFSSDGTTLFVLQDDFVTEDATIEEYSLSVAWDISTASYVDELVIDESANVYAMTMSADGTEVYVAHDSGEIINQYTLSSAWDISTGSYSGNSTVPRGTITRFFSFDISEDGRVLHGNGFRAQGEYVFDTPYDISTLRVIATSSFATVDEDRVADNHLVAGQKIQYFYSALINRIATTKSYRTLSGNLVGDNSLYSLTAETGGNLYIKDTASTSEITVTSDGRLFAPTTTLDIATGYTNNGVFGHNRGTVAFSGTSTAAGTMSGDSSFYSLLVQGSTTLSVAASTTNLTIDATGSLTAPSQLSIAGGYTNNGSFSDNSGTVYFDGEQVDLTNQIRAGVYDVSAEDSLPFAVAVGKNEEKLYVLGFNTVSLYEYDLLIPGDVTSASFATSTSISGDGFTFASDIDFDPAGERMYISESDQIAEYSLSTPWDTSTASFQSSLGASSLAAISFSPTGDRLYVLDDGGEIGQYDLSTPWDVSSLSLVATTSVSAYANNAYGIHITPDGTQVLLTGIDDGTIQRYELGTAWDISSLLSFSNQVAVVVPNSLVALSVTLDGTSGYMIDYLASEIVQIDFSEPTTLAGTMVGASAFNNLDFTGNVWPTFEAAASTTGTFTLPSTGPKQVIFNAGDTYTFQNVDWQGGDESSTVALRSSASGTPWQLDIPGSQLNVSFVDVQDSDATLTSGGVTAATSTDSGNNTNWSFGAAPPTVTVAPTSAITDTTATFNGEITATGTTDVTTRGFRYSTSSDFSSGVATTSESNAYDISTTTFDSIALDVSGQETAPHAMLFNQSGTILYVMGANGNDINAYPLDTPYDISSYTSGTSVVLDVSGEETFPTAMRFNDDGTILYVLGVIGEDINAYPLDTPYDISSYTSGTSVALDVSGQETAPYDMLFNQSGTVLYVMGTIGRDINAYPLDTPFDISSYTSGTSVVLDVSGEETNPFAMLWSGDGTTLYVMGNGDDINAYPLDTPFDISSYTSGTSVVLDVSGEETNPLAMLWSGDGATLYVMGNNGDDINAYTMPTYTTGTYALDIENLEPETTYYVQAFAENSAGVAYSDTTDSFTTDLTPLTVTTASTTDITADAATLNGNIIDIGGADVTTRGFRYSTSSDFSSEVATSSETSPYNIAAATFDSVALDVSGQEISPYAMLFNQSGSVLYVLGGTGRDINAYPLDTPYDISSYTSGVSVALDVSGEETSPFAMLFNDDGTILYVMGNAGNDINAYPLDTPYDISSYTSGTSVVLDVTAQELIPFAMLFNDDGTTLYVMGNNGDDINAYPLPTPYDISSYTSGTSVALDVSGQEAAPRDMLFNDDGTVLYVMGDGDDINAYTMPTYTTGTYALDIDNLESDTTYYVQAFAENSGGLAYSTITDSFTTDGVAVAWNDTDWTEYDTITIDADQVDDDLTDFPVYVDLADLSSTFWSTTPAAAGTVGTDIRVTTNDGSPVELPRELVAASSTAQTGELHFKANNISSTTDTVFRIYYNGNTAGDYATDATYGAENVWSNGYIAVYHFNQDPSEGAGAVLDSTSNSVDGTGDTTMTSADHVSSKLGLGYDFDGGVDDIVNLGSPTVVDDIGQPHICTWYQYDTYSGFYDGIVSKISSGDNDGWDLYAGSFGGNSIGFSNIDGYYQQPEPTVNSGQWYHFCGSWDGTTGTEDGVKVYWDGVDISDTSPNSGSYAAPDPTDAANDLIIAGRNGSGGEFDGRLDEVRIASTTRTDAWVAAAHTNQATTTDFYTVAKSCNDGSGGITCVGEAFYESTLTGGTHTLDLSSIDIQEDDLIVVSVGGATSADRPATIVSSGYSSTTDVRGADSYGMQFRMGWKVVDDTPDTDFQFNFSSTQVSNTAFAYARVYRGVDTSNPIDVTPVSASGSDSGIIDPAAITPLTAGAKVAVFGGHGVFSGVGPSTSNLDSSELSSFLWHAADAGATYQGAIGAGDYTWTSGEYDPAAFTTDNDFTTSGWAAWTVALRPQIDVVGSSTIANHDSGQVDNAFNFQNKTNEPFYAFKLTPESGNATVTELTIGISGARDVSVSDFSNIRLFRDLDNDANYDVSDEQVGGVGVMTPNGQAGTITFSTDFLATTSTNYLVTADWNYPAKGAQLSLKLWPSGVSMIDDDGTVIVSGDVDSVQHSRLGNRGGGGGSSARLGDDASAGDGEVGGGGQDGGGKIDTNTGGGLIGNAPDFFWPTADSGDWTDGANAYDQTDGTYATDAVGSQQQEFATYNDSVPGSDTVAGIAVKLEISGESESGSIDVELSWDGGTSWTNAKTTPTLTTTDTVVTLGGPSDTWGRSWTASEFSNANFSVRLTSNTSLFSAVQVDELQVRVYHQATGGGGGGGGRL